MSNSVFIISSGISNDVSFFIFTPFISLLKLSDIGFWVTICVSTFSNILLTSTFELLLSFSSSTGLFSIFSLGVSSGFSSIFSLSFNLESSTPNILSEKSFVSSSFSSCSVVFDFDTISFIAGISVFKQFTNLLDKFILKTSVDFKFCINLVTIKSNIKVTINIAIFFIEPFAFIIVTLNI